MRASVPSTDTTHILIAWYTDSNGDALRQVAYFDDEREAEYAYNEAPIPSKLFKVIHEVK